MRGSTDVNCVKCGRTIEYRNAELSIIVKGLVCRNCNRSSINQSFADQRLNPIPSRTQSPLLPDLQNITDRVNPLSPLPPTPPFKSPVPKPRPNSSDFQNALPGLQYERIESNYVTRTFNRSKSPFPQTQFPSAARNNSPEPSTSSGMTGLNIFRLHLPSHHDSSGSDIDDPAPICSSNNTKNYITNFHECADKNCKSIKNHQTKIMDLKTRSERYKTSRKNFLRHTCSVKGCEKAFVSITLLWKHQDIFHRGNQPYICQTCGRGFSQSSALTKHKRTHTGEKPYICQTCGKGFSTSGALIRHKYSHNML